MKGKNGNGKSASWTILEFQPTGDYADVIVKGAWDNWRGNKMRKKKSGAFYIRKMIPTGTWEYGFECDGENWQVDQGLSTTESPYGSLNNVISVEG
jgi:hypothetical protein